LATHPCYAPNSEWWGDLFKDEATTATRKRKALSASATQHYEKKNFTTMPGHWPISVIIGVNRHANRIEGSPPWGTPTLHVPSACLFKFETFKKLQKVWGLEGTPLGVAGPVSAHLVARKKTVVMEGQASSSESAKPNVPALLGCAARTYAWLGTGIPILPTQDSTTKQLLRVCSVGSYNIAEK
jgi:hypothetical protein